MALPLARSGDKWGVLVVFGGRGQNPGAWNYATAPLLFDGAPTGAGGGVGREGPSPGTLLQPAQLAAELTAAARALEASGSMVATSLGVEELLQTLLAPESSL